MVYRYFLKELIPQVFITTCVVASIIIVTQFFRISRVVSEFGFTLENILLPFLFNLLPLLATIIPIAFLFAVVITFGRLNSDGELTVFFANGMSLKQMARPVVGLSIVLYFICVFLGLYVEPWAGKEFSTFYKVNAHTQLENILKTQLQPNIFVDNFLDYKFYAQHISKDRTSMQNIILSSSKSSHGESPFVIIAPRATISGNVSTQDLGLSFDMGTIYFFSEFSYSDLQSFDPVSISKALEKNSTKIVHFKKMDLDLIKIFRDRILNQRSKFNADNLYPSELLHYINTEKPSPTETNQKVIKQYYYAKFLFHQRIALPFIIIIFGLISLVVSIQDTRKTRNTSYPAAIATLVIGYCILMSAKGLSVKGLIHPAIALWIPLCLLLMIAIFLLNYKNILPISCSMFSKEGINLLKERRRSRYKSGLRFLLKLTSRSKSKSSSK